MLPQTSSAVFLFLVILSRTSALVPNEQAALADLFTVNILNGLGLTSQSDFCLDPAIVCDGPGDHVIELNFRDIDLEVLPETFWDLPFLEVLDLNKNPLTNKTISPAIGAMTSLRELKITRTAMTGPLPTEIGVLTDLVSIELYTNTFGGPLPQEMRNLVSLETLKVYDNFFDGALPDWLSDLTALEVFGGHENDFTGSVPPSWGTIPTLKTILLADNFITGGFPDTFLNHPSLAIVDLNRNLLDGWLWDGWDTLQGLPTTGLQAMFAENQLTGPVPRSFELIGPAIPPNPPFLQVLELAGNNWYCPIPDIIPWAWSTDNEVLVQNTCVEAPTPSMTAGPTAGPTPNQTPPPTANPTPAPVSSAPCLPTVDVVVGCDGLFIHNFVPSLPPGECPHADDWCVTWFASPTQPPGEAVTICTPNTGSPDDGLLLGPADPNVETVVYQYFGQNSLANGTAGIGFLPPDGNTLLCYFTPSPTVAPTPVPTPAPTSHACAGIPGWMSRSLETSFEPKLMPEMSGFIAGTNQLQIALNISTKYTGVQIQFNPSTCDDHCLSFSEADGGGDTYWAINLDGDFFEGFQCWKTYVVTIPWDSLYFIDNNVDIGIGGLDRQEMVDLIYFTGKLFVDHREWLGVIDGNTIERTILSELNYVVTFPKFVNATQLEPLRVFSPEVALSAVLDQIVVSNGGQVYEADVTVFTSVQWPFRLDTTPGSFSVSVSSPHIPPLLVQVSLKQDCSDPLAVEFADGVKDVNACGQRWTVLIDPNGNCDIDGDYTLNFTPECQPTKSNDCPLVGVGEDIALDFSLVSEDFCAEVIEEVDLVADLIPYRDALHVIQADDYFQDRTVHFIIEAVSAYADIFSTTITQITLSTSINGFVADWDLLMNGGAVVSGDGTNFGLVWDNDPVIQPGDPSQSWFSFYLDSSILEIPSDWSTSLYVTVQLDVEFVGIKLLSTGESIKGRRILMQDTILINRDINGESEYNPSSPKSSARKIDTPFYYSLLLSVAFMLYSCGVYGLVL